MNACCAVRAVAVAVAFRSGLDRCDLMHFRRFGVCPIFQNCPVLTGQAAACRKLFFMTLANCKWLTLPLASYKHVESRRLTVCACVRAFCWCRHTAATQTRIAHLGVHCAVESSSTSTIFCPAECSGKVKAKGEHTFKMYVLMEVQLQLFLTSLVGGE